MKENKKKLVIDVQLTIDEDGKLEKVSALKTGNVKVINEGKETDLTNLCYEYGERTVITDTSVLLIAKSNPTCLYWRVRRTSNGYDYICVEE